MLAAVEEPTERDHPGRRDVAVAEAKGQAHPPTDRGGDGGVTWRIPSRRWRRTARTRRSAAAPRRRSAGSRPGGPDGRGFQGNAPSPTNRWARESPTKNGATTRCSSSARSWVRNWVWTRRLPRPSGAHASTEQVGDHVGEVDRLAAVDHRRHLPEPPPGAGTAWLAQYTSFSLSPVVKKLLQASRWPRSVTVTFIGVTPQPTFAVAPGGAPCAPAVAGCRCGRSRRRPGSRRTPRGRRPPAEVRLVGQHQPLPGGSVEVAVERDAAAQDRVGTLSHGRGSFPSAAGRRAAATDPRPGGQRRPPARRHQAGSRRARSRRTRPQWRPLLGPEPGAPNAHAAMPSRGPQPATLSGSPAASSTSSASGSRSRRGGDAHRPRGQEIGRDVAPHRDGRREHHAGPGGRASTPWRTSPRTARRTRAARDPVARRPRRATSTATGRPAPPGRAPRAPQRRNGDGRSSRTPTATAPPARPGRQAAPRPRPAARARCRRRHARGGTHGARRRGPRRAATVLRNWAR